MTAGARLSIFGVAAVAVFAGGLAIGSAVGPAPRPSGPEHPEPSISTTTLMPSTHDEHRPG